VTKQSKAPRPTKALEQKKRLEPFPKSALEAAHNRVDSYWDKLEEAATRAQGRPNFND
jgi:hypothetical protein